MKRFYNLKIGTPDVMGAVLRVDLSKPLEKRIADISGENEAHITLLEKNSQGAVYEICQPNVTFVNTGREFAVPVESGRPTILRVSLNSQGDIIVVKGPSGKNTYLSEITRKEANSLQEDAREFASLRDYVC